MYTVFCTLSNWSTSVQGWNFHFIRFLHNITRPPTLLSVCSCWCFGHTEASECVFTFPHCHKAARGGERERLRGYQAAPGDSPAICLALKAFLVSPPASSPVIPLSHFRQMWQCCSWWDTTIACATGALASLWHMGGRRASHTFIWPAASCRHCDLKTHTHARTHPLAWVAQQLNTCCLVPPKTHLPWTQSFTTQHIAGNINSPVSHNLSWNVHTDTMLTCSQQISIKAQKTETICFLVDAWNDYRISLRLSLRNKNEKRHERL